VDSVALELPGRGALPPQERTAAFGEAFLPAFRGAKVTLLADGTARASR
jgi:hypothetical protein